MAFTVSVVPPHERESVGDANRDVTVNGAVAVKRAILIYPVVIAVSQDDCRR